MLRKQSAAALPKPAPKEPRELHGDAPMSVRRYVIAAMMALCIGSAPMLLALGRPASRHTWELVIAVSGLGTLGLHLICGLLVKWWDWRAASTYTAALLVPLAFAQQSAKALAEVALVVLLAWGIGRCARLMTRSATTDGYF